MTEAVMIVYENDCETAIWKTKEIARAIGFREADVSMIATAVSELSTNIVRFTQGGRIVIRQSIIGEEEKRGITIVAKDDGPGIKNIDSVMEESFSTFRGSLGLGLPSVKRMMDTFEIQSAYGVGTVITITKELPM